jgi:hypothetical protein
VKRIRQISGFLAKLTISVALLIIVADRADLSGALSTIRKISFGGALTALVLIFGQIIAGSERWRMILVGLGQPITAWLSLQITLIGLFAGQFLPGSIGADITRVWYLRKLSNSLGTSINAVLLERAANLLVIATLCNLGLPILIAGNAPVAAIAVIPCLTLAGFVALYVMTVLGKIGSGGASSAVVRAISRLGNDMSLIVHTRAVCWPVVGWSVLGQLFLCLATFALATSAGIQSLGFAECMRLVPIVALISAIPISLAGWGVREMAMVAVLSYAGAQSEEALALSVALGIVVLVASLLGSVLWLRIRESSSVLSDKAQR